MERERWQRIDSLFKAALDLAPGERSAFLDESCAGDAGLRKEIESLLAHDRAGSFLGSPASEEAARLLAADGAGSLAGQTIGPYKVLERIGAGGMGEVYLALHARQNRRAALKLLPASHAEDRERVERFQQEARAVLALNHPNIVTIYDIERAGDANIIASEFIEGETLRQHVARAPLPFQEALDVAIQTAAALAAAHQAGVVHRDIKPENIMLRPDGYVKVLDFGLAKLTERHSLTTDSDAPPVAQFNTVPGMVMGTVNYMSPEQARGLVVDERTDIWSLGVVLYETLTGHMPFAGETRSDVLAAILQKDPPLLTRHSPEAPEALEWIIAKALTKEKDERYQTAKELLADLKRLRRRLEYEAEAERSAPVTLGGAASIASGGARPAQSAAEEPPSTAETAAVRTVSSAEYIVGEIKRHKRGAAVAFTSLVLALAGIGFGLYINLNRPAFFFPDDEDHPAYRHRHGRRRGHLAGRQVYRLRERRWRAAKPLAQADDGLQQRSDCPARRGLALRRAPVFPRRRLHLLPQDGAKKPARRALPIADAGRRREKADPGRQPPRLE